MVLRNFNKLFVRICFIFIIIFSSIYFFQLVYAADDQYFVFNLQMTGNNLTIDPSSYSIDNRHYVFSNYSLNLLNVDLINFEDMQYYSINYPVYDSANFTLILFSSNGSIIVSLNFSSFLSYSISDLYSLSSEEEVSTFKDSYDYPIIVPYFDNISALEILRNDDLIYTYYLSQNSRCNNNYICENSFNGNSSMLESYSSCPLDCSEFSHDGACNINLSFSNYSFNDGKCDLDCISDTSTYGECSNFTCRDFDEFLSFSDSLFESSSVFSLGNYSYDICQTNNSVKEYYCGIDLLRWDFWNAFTDRVVKSRIENCVFGCINGACIVNPFTNQTTLENNQTIIINETTNETIDLPSEPQRPNAI